MVEYAAVVVADDLTGATDTGVRVARRGYKTTVVTDCDRQPAGDVLVIDTDSRYAEADNAYRRVFGAFDRHGTCVPYKKVDSTLRGNIAAEIDGMINAVDPDLVVVAPAFPKASRTTVSGEHLVDGEPIHTTSLGASARKGTTTSHIPTLLSELPDDVFSLEIDDITQGVPAVSRQLRSLASTGRVVVVCDATSEAHLQTVASATGDLDRDIAYVGSGGLISHVTIDDRNDEFVLAVIGSVAETSLTQLNSLPKEAVVKLDPSNSLEPSADALARTVEELRAAASAAGFAVLTAATSNADVQATKAAGQERGFSEDEIGQRITRTLGRTVASVSTSYGLAGLFVTGGATFRAVLDSMDVTSLSLTGIELEDGVPLATVADGPMAGIPVISKAGAFGGDDTTINCIEFLCHNR